LREQREGRPVADEALAPPPEFQTDEDRWRYTGLTWASFDVHEIRSSSVERSRHRFRGHLPELIWNTAALEGNNFTLPEVKTLLEGVTVGGKKLEDEQQIIALSEAYNRLDELVGAGQFALTKEVSDELHRLVARHEAIESGLFRGEGSVRGGGAVRLASGGVVLGTEHGEGGVLLREHFTNLIDYLSTLNDSRHRALIYFASATRRQFYFDGNKRTARLMMTGELMASGYDLISVPYSRRLEFNNALDVLFDRDDATELLRFLSTCTLPG
jgi:Fic family protein